MKKGTLNFLIDGVALAAFAGMIFTGVILEFTLPPGMGGRRGTGQASQLGMDRHDWGEIHFYLALSFLLLMAIHLFLHWRWIWAMAQGTDPKFKRIRGAAFIAVTLILLLSALIPFTIPKDQITTNLEGAGSLRDHDASAEQGESEVRRQRRGRQENPSP